MGLLKRGLITLDEALRQCSNPDDFKLKYSGISSASDLTWDDFDKDKDAKAEDQILVERR